MKTVTMNFWEYEDLIDTNENQKKRIGELESLLKAKPQHKIIISVDWEAESERIDYIKIDSNDSEKEIHEKIETVIVKFEKLINLKNNHKKVIDFYEKRNLKERIFNKKPSENA